MSAVAFRVSQEMRRLAEPRPAGDSVKAAIGRAARKAGLRYWRAHHLWYGTANMIRADEREQIRRALFGKDAEAIHDLSSALTQLARLVETYRAKDPEFFEPEIDGLLDQIGILGSPDRTGGHDDQSS